MRGILSTEGSIQRQNRIRLSNLQYYRLSIVTFMTDEDDTSRSDDNEAEPIQLPIAQITVSCNIHDLLGIL